MQGEVALSRTRSRRFGSGDGEEVCAVDVFEMESRARIGSDGGELNVAHLDVPDMAEKEAIARGCAEHVGLGVFGFVFSGTEVYGIGGCASGSLNEDIRELQVFDRVVWYPGEDRAIAGRSVVALKIADQHAAERSDLGALLRAAQAGSEAQKDGAGREIAHGDVGDGDVLEESAVNGFKSDAVAALEDAVGDGAVDETAVGFSAELDTSGAGHMLFRAEFLKGAVKKRAEMVLAGHEAVRNGQVARRSRVAEAIAGFGTDSVVPWRVHGAVGDAHVLAAVDIHAVAVGVDRKAVNDEVVDAGEQQAEMAAFEDRETRKRDVAAVLERNCLVADASLLGDKRSGIALGIAAV